MPSLPSPPRRRALSSIAAPALANLLPVGLAGLAGCAGHGDRAAGGGGSGAAPGADPRLPGRFAEVDYLLLGELHDNPEHHALRLRWLEALAGRRRFALAMEQFDADAQPAIDRARAELRPGAAGPEAARAVAEAAGFDFRGWNWEFYRPFVAFALERDFPLLGANLAPAETARIARGAPNPLVRRPAGWSAELDERLAAEIRDGHCGLLPERFIAPMADAQRARDARIARALADARRALRMPVVLLAGNGHVRTDIGVPAHLRELDPGASMLAVGLLERRAAPADGAEAGASRAGPPPFDRVVETAAPAREDPCEALRRRFGGERR